MSYHSIMKLSRVRIRFFSLWNYGTSVARTSDSLNTFWQSLRVRASEVLLYFLFIALNYKKVILGPFGQCDIILFFILMNMDDLQYIAMEIISFHFLFVGITSTNRRLHTYIWTRRPNGVDLSSGRNQCIFRSKLF